MLGNISTGTSLGEGACLMSFKLKEKLNTKVKGEWPLCCSLLVYAPADDQDLLVVFLLRVVLIQVFVLLWIVSLDTTDEPGPVGSRYRSLYYYHLAV